MRILFYTVALISAFFTTAAYGESDTYCGADGLSGISVDSERKLLVAVYYQAVLFPDKSGIRRAAIVAEERAKSEIIRYFDAYQTTSRKISETDSSSQSATRIVDENGQTTNREITREQSMVLDQVDRSMAVGNLRGLQKIEESYDADGEEICVAMAFSAKSNEAAQEAQSWMTGSSGTKAEDEKSEASGADKDPKLESYHKKRKPITG